MAEFSDGPRPEAKVTICNSRGLHARASAKLVQCVEAFDAVVEVTRDGQTVLGTSILGLMMLTAGPGTVLHIQAHGREGPEALEAVVELIENGFGENDP
ncbi:MAG: HPr family phosphocarrier protein [Pseudomonadota bacterium]